MMETIKAVKLPFLCCVSLYFLFEEMFSLHFVVIIFEHPLFSTVCSYLIIDRYLLDAIIRVIWLYMLVCV